MSLLLPPHAARAMLLVCFTRRKKTFSGEMKKTPCFNYGTGRKEKPVLGMEKTRVVCMIRAGAGDSETLVRRKGKGNGFGLTRVEYFGT